MKQSILLVFVAASLQAAVVVGQVDDFQDGTTMGWHVPDPLHPAPPSNVATGGPAGAGDSYLLLTATGDPGLAGGRLSVLSGPQWEGDYVITGVTHLAMVVRNFGPEDLHLRLLLEDFPDAPGPPVNLALSSEAVVVPAGADWTQVHFPLLAGALQAGIFGTVDGALRNVDIIRIFHNPDASFPGPGIGPPPVNAQLGIDNITAAAIPEPAAWWLALGGATLIALRKLLQPAR